MVEIVTVTSTHCANGNPDYSVFSAYTMRQFVQYQKTVTRENNRIKP